MDNVISKCFVICKVNPMFVQPVAAIYLTEPTIAATVKHRWKIQKFETVFAARTYIQKHLKTNDIDIISGKTVGAA